MLLYVADFALQEQAEDNLMEAFSLVSHAAVICLVTQRSSPLRDETNNGCVGDYFFLSMV